MQIDIEKLNRKTPYPEPEDSFFQGLQDRVISKTIGESNLRTEDTVINKKTRVFSLNFQWMAAAAVVLIAGITAFFGFNNDAEMQMAKQQSVVDSVYEIQPLETETSKTVAENNSIDKTEMLADGKNVAAKLSASHEQKIGKQGKAFDNRDRLDYASSVKKPENDVEKILAAFTPDQIKDLDRNSEQDVYLDLYN